MAADRPSKRKRRGAGAPSEGGGFVLRQRNDPRSERRYEPKATTAVVVTMLGMSLGALLAGAGVYAQWLRGDDLGPHKIAPYLLGGGVLLLVALALFGQWMAKPVRVGDAGVALEKGPGEIERIGWNNVTGVLLAEGVLTLQGRGTSIALPLGVHPQAAARALAEAKARIPERTAGTPDDALPKPDDAAGEVLPLDPPQVAGLRCKATEKVIAFERDARLCGRCGELYHKDGVPKACLSCEAPLRA